MRYRNPAQLPPRARRRASSSGVQIATNTPDRAARSCWLWAGICGRPRRYRGIDIFWRVESTGRLARTIDQMPDAVAARREPSPPLPVRNHPAMFDQNLELAALQAIGVRLAGRLERASGDSFARLIPLPGGKRY
jgi:putative flavoprotein involved in K+ transport